eukprot:CAMPEP_0171323832 /NCGR_PEP_ID=MMETSP0816-20121228/115824_1 /TAXON_ID=420281 /ORGANISM="Proboscia inermis, Strain CCAP1064/1" /LENGTH=590 /DNA_ID=CAMNT_0011822643 /DNA_START=559 /DNA_END=2328 /DNA_ORIENTATION=+
MYVSIQASARLWVKQQGAQNLENDLQQQQQELQQLSSPPEQQLPQHDDTVPSSEDFLFDYQTDLTESVYTPIYTSDDDPQNPSILNIATTLRGAYDAVYADPRQPNAERFQFDPWYVTCGDGINGASLPSSTADDTSSLEEDMREAASKQVNTPSNGCNAPTYSTQHNGINGATLSLESSAQENTPLEEEMREAASKQVQYSLKRLQCTHLFNTTHYDTLVDLLTGLGESVGCAGITPPWLSLYLDGDTQNYHSDASHGPLAYVYSLTLDEDYGTFFTGGETMLLDPSVLEYWRGYDGSKGVEAPNLVKYIPPTLGRVVAFDPRIPHGVTPVRGTRDVRHGRVVIHGWFTQPEIQFRGELNTNEIWREEARAVVEAAMDPIIETLGGDIGRILGYLAIQIDVVDGSVTDVTDTQNYHSDASHGPLAYVYSLTLDEDYGTFFTGGETMLLDPSVLEYWRGYDGSKGVEAPNLVKYIPPTFGRVVAFDPRIPHGVTPVRGTRDVRHGRVVIHGWFTQPEIQFRGELNTNEIWREDARLVVEAAMDPIIETLGGDIGRTLGYLAIQLDIVDGSVTDVTAVADTLVADPEDFRG